MVAGIVQLYETDHFMHLAFRPRVNLCIHGWGYNDVHSTQPNQLKKAVKPTQLSLKKSSQLPQWENRLNSRQTLHPLQPPLENQPHSLKPYLQPPPNKKTKTSIQAVKWVQQAVQWQRRFHGTAHCSWQWCWWWAAAKNRMEGVRREWRGWCTPPTSHAMKYTWFGKGRRCTLSVKNVGILSLLNTILTYMTRMMFSLALSSRLLLSFPQQVAYFCLTSFNPAFLISLLCNIYARRNVLYW